MSLPSHDLGHPDPVGQVILGAEPLWALVRVLAAHNVRLAEVGRTDPWTVPLEADLRAVLDWHRRHGIVTTWEQLAEAHGADAKRLGIENNELLYRAVTAEAALHRIAEFPCAMNDTGDEPECPELDVDRLCPSCDARLTRRRTENVR